MLGLAHGVPWSHVFPALAAVLLAFLYLKSKTIYFKVIFGLLWILFLPNTVYIFTDVTHLGLHWSALNSATRIILLIQFIILELIGLVTYLLGMLPFERTMRRRHLHQKAQFAAIIVLNFIIGFGMVLGRVGYINSYVIFTQQQRVFLAIVRIVTTPYLLGLALFFGLICDVIYYLFRSTIIKKAKKYL